MNKANAKSLATLRQKLKKYNRDFEEDITKYRENPDQGEGEEEEEEDESKNLTFTTLHKKDKVCI